MWAGVGAGDGGGDGDGGGGGGDVVVTTTTTAKGGGGGGGGGGGVCLCVCVWRLDDCTPTPDPRPPPQVPYRVRDAKLSGRDRARPQHAAAHSPAATDAGREAVRVGCIGKEGSGGGWMQGHAPDTCATLARPRARLIPPSTHHHSRLKKCTSTRQTTTPTLGHHQLLPVWPCASRLRALSCRRRAAWWP